MSAAMTTVVKRLTVVGGVRQTNDESLFGTSTRSKKPLRTNKGSLLVLAEILGSRSRETQQSIRETVFQTYYRDPSTSITSSLLRAVRKAHHQAMSLYLDDDDQDNVSIGCLVVDDQDIFLAQTGPSLALLSRGGEVYVAGGMDQQEAQAGHQTGEENDTRLFHSQVEPGDVIVLASPNLEQALEGIPLNEIFRRATAAEVRENLYDEWVASHATGDLSVLIVEIGDLPEEESTVLSAALEKLGRRNRRDGAARNPRQPSVSIDGEKTAKRSGRINTEPTDDDSPHDPGDRFATFFSRIGTILTDAVNKKTPANGQPATSSFVRKRGTGDAARTRPVQQGSLIRSVMSRIQPSQWDGTSRLRNVLIAATLLLLVVSCLIGVTQIWQNRQMEANAAILLEQAEAKEQAALAKPEADQKRAALLEAQALIEQATALLQNDPNIRIVKERIQLDLDNVTAVNRITSAGEIIDLSTVGGSGGARKIVSAHNSLYILDTSTQALYRYRLKDSGQAVETDAKPTILRRGDKVGQNTVSNLVGLTTVSAGGLLTKDIVVCMDSQGFLYQYEPEQGLSELKLLTTELSGDAPLLGGYAGNLYLLDAKANRLLWYPPTSTGFDKVVYNYLSPGVTADFSKAVTMAVESELYVLNPNGVISRYSGGQPQTFDASIPDYPLRQAIALAIGPDSKSLFVLDIGNRRVVQYDSAGQFHRQIKSEGTIDLFQDARDLTVDEQHGRLYVLNGKKVLVINLN